MTHSWDPKQRPPAGVCPQVYCVFWVEAGGRADLSRRSYDSLQEALAGAEQWTPFPQGGCGCAFGPCSRVEPDAEVDYYEAMTPALEKDGLPWFYFCSKESLAEPYRSEVLKECPGWWDET